MQASDRRLSLDTKTLIMGVLNVTPDSFSDGGRYNDPFLALDHAQHMVDEGADIIDVGGESTRPGAQPVEAQEEMQRLQPVLQALGARLTVPLSIDTRKAAVARMALDYGASIVNDVSALQYDADMVSVVKETRAGVIVMHMQGLPETMQQNPSYSDIVGETKDFLAKQCSFACDHGIPRENILLDPGFGFGKNVSHNLMLLAHLHELHDLGQPLVVGLSKKFFIGQVLDKPIPDRMMGTAAAVAVAVMNGANVIRVHDVEAMADVVKMTGAIRVFQTN